MGLFSSSKERKNWCRDKPRDSNKIRCGTKWGDKIKKSEDKKGTYKVRQCPDCKEKEKQKRKKTDYKYFCMRCERGWGFEAHNPDNLAKKRTCEKCQEKKQDKGNNVGGLGVSGSQFAGSNADVSVDVNFR